MSKVNFNPGRTPEKRKTIEQRTAEITAELEPFGVNGYICVKAITKYMGCCDRTVRNRLGRNPKCIPVTVKHALGGRTYQASEVAKRLAQLEALNG